MVSCTTAEAGGWLQHGQIGQCLYGECMGMLGSYRGGCLTTDQAPLRAAHYLGLRREMRDGGAGSWSTEEEVLCRASCGCWVTWAWTMGTRAQWAQLL